MPLIEYLNKNLIWANDFCLLIITGQVYFGIIISDAYYKWFPPQAEEAVALQYWAYDVMFGLELVDLVPEEFLDKMIERKINEE